MRTKVTGPPCALSHNSLSHFLFQSDSELIVVNTTPPPLLRKALQSFNFPLTSELPKWELVLLLCSSCSPHK